MTAAADLKPVAWKLDPAFFREVENYEKSHPGRDRGILDSIVGAIDNSQDLLGVIPDSPVPVQSLVRALGTLVKLGIKVKRARKDVYNFAKEIISWVMKISSALRDNGGAGVIADKEMWDHLEELRSLIDEICIWATARLSDSRWRLRKRFSISHTLADFKARLGNCKDDYLHVSVTVFNRRQAQKEHQAKQHAFLSATLKPHIASTTTYVEQGKTICAPGTRVEIIDRIKKWASNMSPGTPRLFWLTGVPGSGKSTLTATLAKSFIDSNILSAQYLFSRSHASTTKLDNVFPSIASQLISGSSEATSAIYEALQQERSLVDKISELQATKLFVEPIQDMSKAKPSQPIVIVLDALDECEGKGRAVAEVFKSIVPTLPANVRILIASRLEEPIREHLFPLIDDPDRLAINCDLELSLSTHDVSQFFRQQVKYIMVKYQMDRREPDWPRVIALDDLCNKTSGLFIWAATAAKFIEQQIEALGRGALDYIRSDLIQQSMNDIDELYLAILKATCHSGSEPSAGGTPIDLFRRIVGCICVLREPLTLSQLETFHNGRGGNVVDVEHFARRFRTVLVAGTENIKAETVPHLHALFIEFITSERRAQQFYVDLKSANAESAILCFSQLSTLHRDMCKIEHLATFNDNIPDLPSRTSKYLPLPLHYACRYWSTHLSLAPRSCRDNHLPEALVGLLTKHLLHWIEATSLIDYGTIPVSLNKAADWAARHLSDDCYTIAKELLYDAGRLIAAFSEPISRSAPHVYISALPFAPKSSRIYQQYHNSNGCAIDVLTRDLPSWPMYSWSIHGSSSVNATCFSPDAKHFASCTGDGTIQLWNTTSGQRAGPSLTGYSAYMTSVAFSPDGRQLVTGSDSKTVCFWNVEHGCIIGKPLTGHHESVTSVAFSYDGRMVASGSFDNTIRRWDAVALRPVGLPLKGHTGHVNSVAFSPNNAQIVSGSNDHTVRCWDAQSGEAFGQPLLGHTDWVWCVAVSPDGRLIASGSRDKTVRLWNALDGSPIGPPLTGHSSWVLTVAFLPDSTRLVSGSQSADQTVYLWDVASACAIGTFTSPHSDGIHSLAFSPDGKQILTCSAACTIRLSDAIYTDMSAPLDSKGHSKQVLCAAFSPSGSLVASGIWETVCLWDAKDGQLILSFETNDRVRSIVFSPDEKRLVTGGFCGLIRTWETATGLQIGQPLVGHTDCIQVLSFSPDGKFLVSGSRDNTPRLWDIDNGRSVSNLEGHKERATCVAFSPDGVQIASGSLDNTIRLWNGRSGQQIGGPITTPGWVMFVAFVPGATTLLSESWWDDDAEGRSLVRLWDTASSGLTAKFVKDFSGTEPTGGEMVKYSDHFALMVSDRWLRTTANGALVSWLPPTIFPTLWESWAYHGAKVVVGGGNVVPLAIIDTTQVLGSGPLSKSSTSEKFKWSSRSYFGLTV